MSDDQALLTADEVARPIKMTPAFIRALAARGEISCVRLGRALRFRPEDVAAFLEAHRIPAGGRR